MRPHPRIRKTIKWGGLVISAALLSLTIWTSGWDHAWSRVEATHMSTLGVGEGIAYFRSFKLGPGLTDPDGSSFSQSLRVDPRNIKWWVRSNRGVYDRLIEVPLWTPALASHIASALAWRLDTLARRREKHGACPSCGYDRAGLAPSSPCPECGKAA